VRSERIRSSAPRPPPSPVAAASVPLRRCHPPHARLARIGVSPSPSNLSLLGLSEQLCYHAMHLQIRDTRNLAARRLAIGNLICYSSDRFAACHRSGAGWRGSVFHFPSFLFFLVSFLFLVSFYLFLFCFFFIYIFSDFPFLFLFLILVFPFYLYFFIFLFHFSFLLFYSSYFSYFTFVSLFFLFIYLLFLLYFFYFHFLYSSFLIFFH
jgi:hypothetical protein